MATSPYFPDEMKRVGGGRGGSSDDFAGLGGSFAGPGAEFTASYLQNRIKGINRSTVNPRVNQMRVMASPEFALAKTLGISTLYNSGGSQVDVQRTRESMSSPSSMERDAATARMEKFQQRAAGVPRNVALSAAGLAAPGDAIQADDSYSGPLPSQSALDQVNEAFGKPQGKMPEVPTTPSGSGGGSTPTIPSPNQATGVRPEPYNVAATPPSAQSARDATRAPISKGPELGQAGSEFPFVSKEQQEQLDAGGKYLDKKYSPTVKETTKGERLDTSRKGGTFEAGQQARNEADQKFAAQLSPDAMQKRAEAGPKYIGPAPVYDQKGIDAYNEVRDKAQREWDANPVGPTGIPYDTEGRMKVAAARNSAQDGREKIKKDFNFRYDRYMGQRDRNLATFGNPYGPDAGKTNELLEQKRIFGPGGGELAPLGGYGEDGAAVGPMTNRPASNQEEYDRRMKRFQEAMGKSGSANPAARA